MSRLDAMDWAGMFHAPGPRNEATTHAGGVARAVASPEPTTRLREYSTSDDRRWCADCERLNTDTGRCSAPAAGLLIASRNYRPVLTMPRRCVAYLPCCRDPIKTPGAVRWPWLNDAV